MTRRLVLGIVLYVALSWASTTYAPAPACCYERATWDGKNFVPSGEWRCL